MIPHRFPFRFVDDAASVPDGVAIRCSGGDWAGRGLDIPAFLGLEMLAQASILLLRDAGAPSGTLPETFRDVRLGGVQAASFLGAFRPGDLLVARTRVAGRFGKTLKVTGTLERDGSALLEADLLLVL